MDEKNTKRNRKVIERLEDPPIAQALFGSVKWAWLWLLVRLLLGAKWLQSGWGKITNPAWVGSASGTALTGFAQQALTKTGGEHPDVQAWYAWFLQHAVLPHASFWSYLVSLGEFMVGVAMILGLFTGIAAFFGLFMNESYLLAGSVSVNPIMLLLAILIILAWKVAGWWGFDRWLLPALGTPWQPGTIFRAQEDQRRTRQADQTV
jgi:thiosulfate dehydrogenase [quinone] large subunit